MITPARTLILALLLFVTGALPAPLAAQALPDNMGTDLAVEYARPGRATMTVYLWGDLGTPGVWRVERDVDLIDLLSAARVSGIGRDAAGVASENTLHIYRGPGSDRQQIYEVELEQLLGEGADYPDLSEGDVLVIETKQRQRFGLQEASQLVTTISTLTLLVLQLSN